MRLWHRLFIAFATLSVLTLLGYVAWQQYSFGQGFNAYLDSLALNQARAAAPRIAQEYAQYASWDFLRKDPRRFGGLIGDAPPRPGGSDARENAPLPPDERSARPHRGMDGPPPMRFVSAARLLLFDENGQRVAGNTDPDGATPAVAIVNGGREVGILAIARVPQMDNSPEMDFARSQLRGAAIAGAAVLLIALLLAYALARWLLKPVDALTRGTRALASGELARRVPVKGRDEFAVLATDFNHLASTLEQHRESRRQWGADIAHELRTPVTILRVELQTLIEGIRPLSIEAMASLSAECDRLAGLVEDLYQLSLADAGALEYRFGTVDLCELAQDAGHAHRAALAAIGLNLDEDIATQPVLVRADGRRLLQLVDNLLLNAQRYTDAPGKVVLRVSRSGDAGALTVEDSAPGVDSADLPRLFERLFRTDRSRNRAAGGAGLGLAICRAIADAHGAQLVASPSVLGGLCVSLTLPIMDDVA